MKLAMTGFHRAWRRRWRLAAVAACAALSTLVAWPAIEAAAARPGRSETAEDAAARRVYASFDPVAIDDALIAQPARIAAAVAALPAHPARVETVVLAVGGDGFQAIFDREAQRAAAVLATRFGGPALVLSNTVAQAERGLLASPKTVDLAVAALGRRSRPGDTLIVYLASHGGKQGLIAMDAPRFDFAPLTARRLAGTLDRAGFKRRIVIVSACFGASWTPLLASPTTIVIAAAAADRTSFGCDDRRELTVFGEALLGALANRDLPLATAFDRAKRRITTAEQREREVPSLPQASVGAAMKEVWTTVP